MAKQVREQHAKVQKQKERLLRELKRAETHLRNVKDELGSANMTIEKLRTKVSLSMQTKIILVVVSSLQRSTMPGDDQDLEQQKDGLKFEIDDLSKTHEKQVCLRLIVLITLSLHSRTYRKKKSSSNKAC